MSGNGASHLMKIICTFSFPWGLYFFWSTPCSSGQVFKFSLIWQDFSWLTETCCWSGVSGDGVLDLAGTLAGARKALGAHPSQKSFLTYHQPLDSFCSTSTSSPFSRDTSPLSSAKNDEITTCLFLLGLAVPWQCVTRISDDVSPECVSTNLEYSESVTKISSLAERLSSLPSFLILNSSGCLAKSARPAPALIDLLDRPGLCDVATLLRFPSSMVADLVLPGISGRFLSGCRAFSRVNCLWRWSLASPLKTYWSSVILLELCFVFLFANGLFSGIFLSGSRSKIKKKKKRNSKYNF